MFRFPVDFRKTNLHFETLGGKQFGRCYRTYRGAEIEEGCYLLARLWLLSADCYVLICYFPQGQILDEFPDCGFGAETIVLTSSLDTRDGFLISFISLVEQRKENY